MILETLEIVGSGAASLLLVFLCITSGILREQRILDSLYGWLNLKLKSKRLTLFLLSGVSGLLPIHGRVMVTAPLLSPLVTPGSKNPKLSVISYLATHHYYLWSPLEKALLISMAGLGLSYQKVLISLAPFLAFMLIFSLAYLLLLVKEEDLHTEPPGEIERSKLSDVFFLGVGIAASVYGVPIYITFMVWAFYLMIKYGVGLKKAMGYINWNLILLVALSVMVGTLARNHSQEISEHARWMVARVSSPFWWGLGISFLFGLSMGSSARYGAFTVVACSFLGDQNFGPIYVAGFCGYLLSPAHQCLPIVRSYFGSPRSYFYGILAVLVVGLLAGVAILKPPS